MQIIPPELLPYSPDRYGSDINYREEVDLDVQNDRRQRLLLLFNPHLIPNDEY